MDVRRKQRDQRRRDIAGFAAGRLEPHGAARGRLRSLRRAEKGDQRPKVGRGAPAGVGGSAERGEITVHE
ncbi:MAG: hypothetical protein LC634_00630 [Sphingomonadales bacterium]|nr:hypothetical protein [Sphingomonadales bacterium]